MIRISEAIAMLEEVRNEMGDVPVVFLDHEGDEFFSFWFPTDVAGVGMPNEDETAEELVCAFVSEEIEKDMNVESGTKIRKKPKFSVVK
jgi:hypothetical protein